MTDKNRNPLRYLKQHLGLLQTHLSHLVGPHVDIHASMPRDGYHWQPSSRGVQSDTIRIFPVLKGVGDDIDIQSFGLVIDYQADGGDTAIALSVLRGADPYDRYSSNRHERNRGTVTVASAVTVDVMRERLRLLNRHLGSRSGRPLTLSEALEALSLYLAPGWTESVDKAKVDGYVASLQQKDSEAIAEYQQANSEAEIASANYTAIGEAVEKHVKDSKWHLEIAALDKQIAELSARLGAAYKEQSKIRSEWSNELGLYSANRRYGDALSAQASAKRRMSRILDRTLSKATPQERIAVEKALGIQPK